MDANDPRAERFKKTVESADAGEIRRLFDAHPELEQVVDEPWFAFDTPALVYVVAWNGEREHIDVLLAHGADRTLLERTHSGTPSGWANANGHDGLAELLR